MDRDEAIRDALALAGQSTIAMVGTNGDDGYPNIKAMIKMETEGLKTVWFSTNTSSKRIAQLARNSKACVYFVDPLGVTDPDYSVLRFTSEWGNYYHALSNVTFEL